MQTLKAKPMPLKTPEAVLNLWAYVDDGGYIFRLAGKAYVMDGNDSEKVSLLRQLSKTDFLSAPSHRVPSSFNLIDSDNKCTEGVAHRTVLSDRTSFDALFGPLIEHLAEAMPTQLRCENNDFKPFRVDIPKDPLTVATIVLEHDDGRLVPIISGD